MFTRRQRAWCHTLWEFCHQVQHGCDLRGVEFLVLPVLLPPSGTSCNTATVNISSNASNDAPCSDKWCFWIPSTVMNSCKQHRNLKFKISTVSITQKEFCSSWLTSPTSSTCWPLCAPTSCTTFDLWPSCPPTAKPLFYFPALTANVFMDV